MNNDIETMLHEVDAPGMGIDPDAVIAGAKRTRRRRRTTVSAFGLAAALVVGVGVGADQLSNRAEPVPATRSVTTTAPMGTFFKDSRVGDQRTNQYIVSGTEQNLSVRPNLRGSAALKKTGSLPGGVAEFQDGQHTVVLAPLPAGTDAATVDYKDGVNAGGMSGESARLSTGRNIGVFFTERPAAPRAVRWNVGAKYYSNTGERGQVASFSDARIVWYPKLNVFLLDAAGAGYSTVGGPASQAFLAAEEVYSTNEQFRFASPVPHGARNISVKPKSGLTLSRPQVRRLGTTRYDMVYVTAKALKSTSERRSVIVGTSAVQSVTWTDGTGRHTKKY